MQWLRRDVPWADATGRCYFQAWLLDCYYCSPLPPFPLVAYRSSHPHLHLRSPPTHRKLHCCSRYYKLHQPMRKRWESFYCWFRPMVDHSTQPRSLYHYASLTSLGKKTYWYSKSSPYPTKNQMPVKEVIVVIRRNCTWTCKSANNVKCIDQISFNKADRKISLWSTSNGGQRTFVANLSRIQRHFSAD